MRVRDTSSPIFSPGQMPADAGLGALAYLDLDGGAGVQVLRVHAEAPGGHLHHGAVGP